jgi:hypothetical protein
VHTMHSTLLIGPADWQPERMPKSEFVRRIDALWQNCPAASHALVCGTSRYHAELAYLTNFVPKIEPAVALLSRTSEPRLFVGGGANMLGAARPLTWIAEVAPLKELERIRLSECAVIGDGYLNTALCKSVIDASGAGDAAPDATQKLWTLMRRKSPAELAAIRAACTVLDAAMAQMVDAHRRDEGVTTVVLAGERAANEHGAQDVRTLFSLNGGRTLVPFETPEARVVDPLQIYVAVRRFNYWAEGFVLLTHERRAVHSQAAAILQSAINATMAGTLIDDLARVVATGAFPYHIHVVVADCIGPLGLALDAPPYAAGAALRADEVCSLRVGFTNGAGENAVVSAMVAVREDGNEVLWPAQIA